ncbi:MAG: phage tail assembly protein [Desulfovibrio sp.]|nr:phage tail assembly protein [Desulfovibrio sp.]
MSRNKTVILSEAIEVGGKQITEVIIRRSTVGDEEDAMQQAIQIKRARNAVTVEMCLMSRLTRLPYDAIRNMCGPDYAALRMALNELNGGSPEEENPMTDGTAENDLPD